MQVGLCKIGGIWEITCGDFFQKGVRTADLPGLTRFYLTEPLVVDNVPYDQIDVDGLARTMTLSNTKKRIKTKNVTIYGSSYTIDCAVGEFFQEHDLQENNERKETMRDRLESLNKHGFVKLMEIPFFAKRYRDEPEVVNYWFCFFNPEHFALAVFDTVFKEQKVNTDRVYYQRRCDDGTLFMFSGRSYSPVFLEPIPENFENFTGDEKERFYNSRTLIGAHETKEFWGFIHRLQAKPSLRDFLVPWTVMPHLWLIHHGDDSHLNHTTPYEVKSNLYETLSLDRERRIRVELKRKFNIELSTRTGLVSRMTGGYHNECVGRG